MLRWLVMTSISLVLSGHMATAETRWRNVNVGWQVSCGADRGSIVRTGSDYTFKTSSNQCPGGIFNQRAEIRSDHISVNEQVTYLVETTIALETSSNEPAIIFHIHDGRIGCSPPMSYGSCPTTLSGLAAIIHVIRA